MFGDRLLEIRKALRLTQEEIAANTGISYRAYSSYERDERNPSFEFLEKIVKLYDVNLNWLIADSGDMFASKATQFVQVKAELLSEVRQMLKDEGIIQ